MVETRKKSWLVSAVYATLPNLQALVFYWIWSLLKLRFLFVTLGSLGHSNYEGCWEYCVAIWERKYSQIQCWAGKFTWVDASETFQSQVNLQSNSRIVNKQRNYSASELFWIQIVFSKLTFRLKRSPHGEFTKQPDEKHKKRLKLQR